MRNLEACNRPNDGTRSVLASVLIPEVVKALTDWKENCDTKCVLIGGLAVSYYCKPRTTLDIDVLFLSESDIPSEVAKFKRARDHAFMHKDTHVDVEVLTPDFLKVPSTLVHYVVKTAYLRDAIFVATPVSLVILKLFRWTKQDQADAENLFKVVGLTKHDFEPLVHLLPTREIVRLASFISEMENGNS